MARPDPEKRLVAPGALGNLERAVIIELAFDLEVL
jgi:hypothetical protein